MCMPSKCLTSPKFSSGLTSLITWAKPTWELSEVLKAYKWKWSRSFPTTDSNCFYVFHLMLCARLSNRSRVFEQLSKSAPAIARYNQCWLAYDYVLPSWTYLILRSQWLCIEKLPCCMRAKCAKKCLRKKNQYKDTILSKLILCNSVS